MMSEEQNIPPQADHNASSTSEGNWQEVGRQFQALGESLAQAMHVAWENESTQRRVQEMRTGLESMARDIGKAVEDTASSPQGQRFREEAHHTAETLRSATEQAVQEIRPQLINALQTLNDELQRLINRIEKSPSPDSTSPGSDSDPDKPL